jgi:phosphatidylserine/phosphatidylglycerophosphate/cardiolipin synthase-like enzyme
MRKTIILVFVVALILGVEIGAALSLGPRTATTTTITTTAQLTSTTIQTIYGQEDILEVCYSPGGNCANRVIYWIDRANSTIHILIYSFTLDTITAALVKAKGRGLDVKVVMDNQQAAGQGSEYQALLNAGIQVRLDRRSADMHDKVAIIDRQIVITGSFNWSAAANNENNENLLVIQNQAWAAKYEAEFQRIWTQYT